MYLAHQRFFEKGWSSLPVLSGVDMLHDIGEGQCVQVFFNDFDIQVQLAWTSRGILPPSSSNEDEVMLF